MSIYQGDQKVANNITIENASYSAPIGTIISYASTTLPIGFLLCDGSEISKTDYADLYIVIGNKFGTATDTTKFKLPDLRDRFIQGANGNLGASKDAGLPNITGTFYHDTNAKAGLSGAFASYESTGRQNLANDPPTNSGLITFDASKSNSIYGNSDTVQPPSVCLTFIIKAEKISDQYAAEEIGKIEDSVSELREDIDNQYGGKWIFKKTNPANYLYPMIDWKTENYNFTVGDTYYIKPFFFSSDKFKSTGNGIAVYGYTSHSEYEKLFNLNSIGESNIFTLTKSYVKLRIVFTLTNADTNAFDFGVYFTKLNDALISHTIDLENKVAHLSNKKRNNVLILGDSYSAMGTWIEKLNNKISLGTIVNLAVGSARLKDKYGDRTAYPYSNRPSSAAEWNSNQNTFACQIEKLKRLMVGTDLDVGEIKLYKSSTEYPSIIFVEGGKNDAKDTSTDNYIDAIYSVQRGYYKRKTTDSTAVESNVKIPTPYTDTDRTNFAGAMRYIYGALHNIFPEAMIFFFTPSGINYALDGLHYVEKSNQIKKAAELLCTPIIDWASNGRLTYADNVVTGDGTVDNPYIGSVASDYTLDSIHPNDKGADYLADEVAKILVAYNLASYLS